MTNKKGNHQIKKKIMKNHESYYLKGSLTQGWLNFSGMYHRYVAVETHTAKKKKKLNEIISNMNSIFM